LQQKYQFKAIKKSGYKQNFINFTKFVKTKSLNNMTHTLQNLLWHVQDRDWGGGGVSFLKKGS
jgi:hypothetical protein